MKNTFHPSSKSNSLILFDLKTISALFFVAAVIGAVANNNYFKILKNDVSLSPIVLPDSSLIDTNAVATEYMQGDTIQSYMDGSDTVYVLYEDTTVDTSLSLGKELVFDTKHILVTLGNNYQAVQYGQDGINISDIFAPGHANENELAMYNTTTPGVDDNPWDLLSDLCPKSIRAFSGSGSKFMQPIGSITTTSMFLPYKHPGWYNGGYGYNLEEIIAFFDATDNDAGVPVAFPGIAALGGIDHFVNSLTAGDCYWMSTDSQSDFLQLKDKYFAQPEYDPATYHITYPTKESEPLYINQFIHLINKIETENPGHIVDVILCLDIQNQTASDCTAEVNYLKTNTTHPVHVVGVELGNEVYFKFGAASMGFTDFDHYWQFINGGSYPADFDLASVLPADVYTDHNYILKFKGDPDFWDIKIGIPGTNINNTCGYAFRTSDSTDTGIEAPTGGGGLLITCDYWNDCLATHYSDMIGTKYAFDAVVLHPYYTASNANLLCPTNTNWKAIPVSLNTAAVGTPGTTYSPVWDYATYDEDLRKAFDGIAGIPNPLAWGGVAPVGNFREFTQTRIKQAYTEQSTHLLFAAANTGPQYKEIWTTESNLLDRLKGTNSIIDQPYAATTTNTLVHATMFQEWFLKNIKLNLDHDYRSNFFTYATWQNFLGGSTIDLLGMADLQDEVELDYTHCPPYVGFYDNYYLPRTTYYTMKLLSTINKNQLNYMKSVISMYAGNVNQPPSVFIAPLTSKKLYLYYTNVKSTTQTYMIDPGYLSTLYPGYVISLDPAATIHCVNGDQLYSTSGRNSLFMINTGYNTCSTSYLNRFEIQSTWDIPNSPTCPAGAPAITGGICVTVPATSCGYVEINIIATARLGNSNDLFNIYPNPAGDQFSVHYLDIKDNDHQPFHITIKNIAGATVEELTSNSDLPINITQLPVGVYMVLIKKTGYATETEQLVKMH